jgi:hypothetical protein
MVDTGAQNTLLQYGALGAIAVVFLGIVSFAFRVILIRFLRAFDQLVQTLRELTKDMAVHSTEMGGQHRQVLTTMHSHHTALVEKIDGLERRRQKTGGGT